MSAPKKPFWLTPAQALLPVVAVLMGLTCLALSSVVQGKDVPAETPYMLVAIGGLFIVGAIIRCWMLYRVWSRWTYVTYKNVSLMVDAGGYRVNDTRYNLDKAAVILEVIDAFKYWWAVFGHDEVNAVASRAIIWIQFTPAPLMVFGKPVAGYTLYHSRSLVVAYQSPDQNIHETSLQHEVGHLVQGEVNGWDELRHHEVSEAYGLR